VLFLLKVTPGSVLDRKLVPLMEIGGQIAQLQIDRGTDAPAAENKSSRLELARRLHRVLSGMSAAKSKSK
jgi:hypothetical protein